MKSILLTAKWVECRERVLNVVYFVLCVCVCVLCPVTQILLFLVPLHVSCHCLSSWIAQTFGIADLIKLHIYVRCRYKWTFKMFRCSMLNEHYLCVSCLPIVYMVHCNFCIRFWYYYHFILFLLPNTVFIVTCQCFDSRGYRCHFFFLYTTQK